jgi:hypothetical protein
MDLYSLCKEPTAVFLPVDTMTMYMGAMKLNNKNPFETISGWADFESIINEKKKVVVIYNTGVHWITLVADLELKVINVMCSLQSYRNTKSAEVLLNLLEDAAGYSEDSLDPFKWRITLETGKGYPKQNNTNDCGIYAILNAAASLKGMNRALWTSEDCQMLRKIWTQKICISHDSDENTITLKRARDERTPSNKKCRKRRSGNNKGSGKNKGVPNVISIGDDSNTAANSNVPKLKKDSDMTDSNSESLNGSNHPDDSNTVGQNYGAVKDPHFITFKHHDQLDVKEKCDIIVLEYGVMSFAVTGTKDEDLQSKAGKVYKELERLFVSPSSAKLRCPYCDTVLQTGLQMMCHMETYFRNNGACLREVQSRDLESVYTQG